MFFFLGGESGLRDNTIHFLLQPLFHNNCHKTFQLGEEKKYIKLFLHAIFVAQVVNKSIKLILEKVHKMSNFHKYLKLQKNEKITFVEMIISLNHLFQYKLKTTDKMKRSFFQVAFASILLYQNGWKTT